MGQRRSNQRRVHGSCGFTLIELLVVVAVIGVLAAIAVPLLLRARMSSNEASAIGSLRAVNSAQVTYSTTCAQGFAATMTELASPPALGGQLFISPELGQDPVIKSGYTLSYTPGPPMAAAVGSCTGTPGPIPVAHYAYAAAPAGAGTSGSRFFGTSERQTVYQDSAAITFGAPPGRAPSGSAIALK